jgi:two-component system chemotaxis response regulator CheB
MIRVVIAEDSATTQELLRHLLSSDPSIQVVGPARNGREAVELTQSMRPDIVTMDIHMPVMDGFAATKEIMITAPTPIVIITGSSKARDLEISMHALRAGALDVLVKPPGPESPAFADAAQKIVASVKAMAQVKVVRHWRSEARTAQPRPGARRRVVAMAASTGGPAALNCILAELPGNLTAPILVVQHITAGFIGGLASWLHTGSDLRVKLGEQGELLAPQTVYFAPDGFHLGVTQELTILLSKAAPIGGFRPSGTFLFESVARVFGPSALAVILTGMGEDGVAGLRAVHAAGGLILAQNAETSVVFGMPAAAINAGLADQVMPLDALAGRICELV